ncbi:RecF/RecN/SMC protein [Neocallimastix sp. 'constans']|jgi:structural maintenance of chromosome 2
MRIQELIIEGFKSYASRTVITGWDPQFNAITGLNGSGKSNILDAICFLLGITNLSHVRANSLQDLVYKRGQAGITKASVTIVFNNEDRAKSPLGYEECKTISITRQIIIGGRNKYLINGHNAQQQNVANLFQSVQLNVNNPHFLIMQGKITQVLNMKPPEILAMIEEAAGTRMFEEKKKKARETMAKKDKKLEEISSILNEEIFPKLDKLRNQKKEFIEYQKIETELDYLQRLIIAYDFQINQERLDRSDQDLQLKQKVLEELNNKYNEFEEQKKVMEKEINEITLEREKELKTGGHFQELDETVKEISRKLVKIKTQKNLKIDSMKEEAKSLESLDSNIHDVEEAISKKKEEFDNENKKLEQIKLNHKEEVKKTQKLEELLQTLTTGMAAKEGHENGYMEQLTESKKQITIASTENEQARIKISHLKEDLKEWKPKANMAERENKNLLKEKEIIEKEINKFKEKVESFDIDPNQEHKYIEQLEDMKSDIYDIKDKIDRLSSQLVSLNFDYTDPYPGFDKSKIKGLVAELITIPKDKIDTSLALEITAGGRLYNVVVENEVVGADLLEHGRLKRRVTILPLNKINAYTIPQNKIDTAKSIWHNKVNIALSLIGYDEEVEAAMRLVFGSTFICSDPTVAKDLSYSNKTNVKSRCVTLAGDIYDPSGTLSGGAKPSSAGILNKVQDMKELQVQLMEIQNKEQTMRKEFDNYQRKLQIYKQIKKEYDLKLHQKSLLDDQLSKSSYARCKQMVDDIEKQLIEQQEIARSSSEKLANAKKEAKRIENEMNDFANNKESKLEQMKIELNNSKKNISKQTQIVQNCQRNVDVIQCDLDQLEKDKHSINDQKLNINQTIEKYKNQIKEFEDSIKEVEIQYQKSKEELDKERKLLSQYDDQLKNLENDLNNLSKQNTEIQLAIKKIKHDLERFNNDKKNSHRLIQIMLNDYPWINEQKSLFGKPNTPYDFNAHNIDESKKRLKQLEERHESLRKQINMKVMDTIDRVEKKEASLKQMFSTVKRDKSKIEETIKSLDGYKRDALETTWEKVNVDFGSIFSELLPGNSAKLEAPEGQTITQGLEVKVCLGGVWKQSLTELSGGQRSLIALSLILSLLQFKPAPMYILDEVDAALDLSHTQNIGQLLRTRFKGSQFIVVSLKEGMFNNANVLFKAKFKDGNSTVERIAQRKKNIKDLNERRRALREKN